MYCSSTEKERCIVHFQLYSHHFRISICRELLQTHSRNIFLQFCLNIPTSSVLLETLPSKVISNNKKNKLYLIFFPPDSHPNVSHFALYLGCDGHRGIIVHHNFSLHHLLRWMVKQWNIQTVAGTWRSWGHGSVNRHSGYRNCCLKMDLTYGGIHIYWGTAAAVDGNILSIDLCEGK